MSHTFIHALWGDVNDPGSRVHKIRSEVARVPRARHRIPSIAFVYGRDNFEFVRSHGIDAVLLREEPFWRDGDAGSVWRNKMEAFRAAAAEFDEVVLLDWDISALRPVDARYVFDRLRLKSPLQANCLQYRRRKVNWRRNVPDGIDPCIRRLPSGAFIYCRERFMIDGICDVMDGRPKFSEEQAIAFYIDELHGGWKGVENYLFHHEPFCCRVKRSGIPAALGAYRRTKEHIFSY